MKKVVILCGFFLSATFARVSGQTVDTTAKQTIDAATRQAIEAAARKALQEYSIISLRIIPLPDGQRGMAIGLLKDTAVSDYKAFTDTLAEKAYWRTVADSSALYSFINVFYRDALTMQIDQSISHTYKMTDKLFRRRQKKKH